MTNKVIRYTLVESCTDWGVLMGECSLLITVSVGCVLSLYLHSTLTLSNKPTPYRYFSNRRENGNKSQKISNFSGASASEFSLKIIKNSQGFFLTTTETFQIYFQTSRKLCKKFSKLPITTTHIKHTSRKLSQLRYAILRCLPMLPYLNELESLYRTLRDS